MRRVGVGTGREEIVDEKNCSECIARGRDCHCQVRSHNLRLLELFYLVL